jgi:Tfp pilus assembly protein PilZ
MDGGGLAMSGGYTMARGTLRGAAWRVVCRCTDWAQAAQVATAGVDSVHVPTTRTPRVGVPVALVIELPDGIHVDLRGKVTEVVAAGSGRTAGVIVEIAEQMASELALLRSLIDEELRGRVASGVSAVDAVPEVLVDGDSAPVLRALGGASPTTRTSYSVKLKEPRRKVGKLRPPTGEE